LTSAPFRAGGAWTEAMMSSYFGVIGDDFNGSAFDEKFKHLR